jgi:SAM-dependent methyltransferase
MTERTSSYVPDQAWADERARLAAMAQIYDPGTIRLLEDIGVAPGWSCLEVGAGQGAVAGWLADRVTAQGRVLAVDLDPRFLSERPGLEVRRHDILEGPPEQEAFDLVHARAVVEWIVDRPAALRSMVAALRPGGWLLVEDVDVAVGMLSDPVSPTRQRVTIAIADLARSVGADLYYGRLLPDDVRALGLTDLGVDARATVQHGGEPSGNFQRLTLTQLAPTLIAHGLITEADLATAEVDFEDPTVVGYSPLMVAAWGRKPA